MSQVQVEVWYKYKIWTWLKANWKNVKYAIKFYVGFKLNLLCTYYPTI